MTIFVNAFVREDGNTCNSSSPVDYTFVSLATDRRAAAALIALLCIRISYLFNQRTVEVMVHADTRKSEFYVSFCLASSYFLTNDSSRGGSSVPLSPRSCLQCLTRSGCITRKTHRRCFLTGIARRQKFTTPRDSNLCIPSEEGKMKTAFFALSTTGWIFYLVPTRGTSTLSIGCTFSAVFCMSTQPRTSTPPLVRTAYLAWRYLPSI